MAKKAPRKRKAEYAPKRPVLSVRVDEKIFADISREAAARNITLTAEIYRRLISYQLLYRELGARPEDMQKAEEEVRKVLEEVRKAKVEGFEAELERRGYTRISGSSGTVWAEPGIKNFNVPTGAAEYRDLETTIDAAVERAVAKALKDRKE